MVIIIESIGVAALGWVASPLVGKLLNEGFKSLGINADKKLQDLRVTVLPLLKSVIEKAEGSAHQSEVEDWLQRLKDAYDDAEDELELLNYHHLRHKRRANGVRSPFRVPKPPKLIMPILKGCRDMMSLRRIKLKRKLIAREALKLRDLLGAQPDQTAAAVDGRRTISVPPLKVFGRDKERDEIIRRLKMNPAAIRDPGSSSMPTIAIREPGSSSMPTVAIRKPGSSSIPTIAIHKPGSSSMPTITINNPGSSSMPTITINNPGSSSMPTIAIHEPGSLVIPIIAIHEPGSLVIPIIAIVGRPGVGKTTLAQYVCKKLKSEGRDKHFHLIMWVHASHNFNVSEIMKNIIQAACTASERQGPINLDGRLERIETNLLNLNTVAVGNLDNLQQKMSTMLTTKKFLLVIDDVWCDGDVHKNNWDTLFRCLSNCCSPGCKILVTSQTDDAPRKIVATKSATLECIHDLKELEKDEFLDLFIHHALPGGEIDSSLRKDLEKECKTIAKKLNKDPTAAKIVGETIALKLADLIRSKGDCRTYLRIIAEKDWSDNKTQALMWSYRQLPAHLQRCFSYCSLYGRVCLFEESELVQLWMAQGFIKPDDQNGRMEKVGKDYLEMLVSRFYIQSCDRDYPISSRYPYFRFYTLHELLYDLAEKVSRNYCVRIKGNHQNKIPSTIRHLSIPANKLNEKKEEICKLKKLRTLIVTKGESDASEENVATDIFKRLKKLRVLVLEVNIENLAEFIDEMKHLRILKVPETSKLVLSESFRTLYQLQELDVEDFCVSKEKGNELEQLQNLNELRGCLRIENLENVKSKESAIAANLKEKKYLDELYLVWSDSEDNVNSDLDVEILESLQLPPYLTGLYLDGYRGQLWPSWPECQTSNIEKLELRWCNMLEELPPMDQLYPSCGSLELCSLSKLKALHTLPPRLQGIEITGTPFLTFATNEDLQMSPAEKRSIIEVMRKSTPEWFPHQDRESLVADERGMRNFIAAMNDSNNEASSAEHNKSVPADDMDITAVWERWLERHERKMELIYNRQNEAKLLLPSTLTVLKLWSCNITDHALSACLQTLTSLTYLYLVEIRTVTCLPSEDVLGKLKALHYLSIWDFWALSSLGGIGSLPHLKKLYLKGCPCLDSKTAFRSSSLEKIQFDTCANVDVILANAELPCLSLLRLTRCHMRTASLQFGNLPSLRSLSISNCPGSFSVDLQKLHSLEDLYMQNCTNLQELKNFRSSSLEKIQFETCANVDAILANADLPCLSRLKITRWHMRTASLQFSNLPSLRSLSIWDCRGLSFSVDLQELRSLELLALWNCSNLQEVMNFPGSLKHLRISICPILERSMNIDPCSRVLMLSGIPVEDIYGRPLIRVEEES